MADQFATPVGVPAGNWPGDSQRYLLSSPLQHEERLFGEVVVAAVTVPDGSDPDAEAVETSVYGQLVGRSVLVGGFVGVADHGHVLRQLGYQVA